MDVIYLFKFSDYLEVNAAVWRRLEHGCLLGPGINIFCVVALVPLGATLDLGPFRATLASIGYIGVGIGDSKLS